MQRFRWIALQGSSRGFLPPLLLFFLITTSGIPAHAADDPTACRTPVARVVSIQGSIEVLRARQNDWSKVTRLDTPLCEGDRLRTGALSRAALFIQPETLVRVDQNTIISVSQTQQETLVEFTQEDVLPAAVSAYSCGAGYFITRFPRKFRVKTPHLNAAVEGTEFLVAMRCETTELSVFEGKVLAAGAGDTIFPAQSVSSGQVLTIGGSEPPAIKLLVKPADAVQWVVYYPPLSDAAAEADLPPAEECRTLPKPLDQTCLTQRAETLLRLGRVDEAQREVDEAVALDPGSGDANALRAIISIARNDKTGAMQAAMAATTASPNSSRAWLALSYAQQASFKLDASLVSARKAQSLEPNSSVTNSRVAELLMSLGRIKEAEVAARAAVDANPSESRAHTVLGFVHLAQIKTQDARTDFLDAIERDSSDPLPRLGLGLAIIRSGKLEDGREQLEIAVALDPTNSLLRSYVGKAYYEENTKERNELASTQFGLSKELDPNDPTPWFYEAILKQAQNHPVDALRELQQSIEKNDNRTVYRSQLLLDTDQAARSVSLAQVYADLGFDQLAIVEAAKSLALEPGNYSAHRLLSETYERLPRSNFATESERLQALLRTPLNITPISPFRTQRNPFSNLFPKTGLTPALGPTRTGLNEFNPLFERTGAGLVIDGMAGTRGSGANQGIFSLLTESVSVGVGYGHFATDGLEDNRDFAQNAYVAFFQARASDQISLQAEFTGSRSDRGDFFFAFDPGNVIPLRVTDDSNATRVGARYEINERSDFMVSGIYQTFASDVTNLLFGLQGRFEWQAGSEEIQYTYRRPDFNIVAGLGHTDGRQELVGLAFEIESRYNNAYVYTHLSNPDARVLLMAGLSYDVFREGALERDVSSPKAGLIWQPWKHTTLRAAAFKAVKRPIIADQTIEPTQVVGFNQFFDDFNATVAWRYGIGLDWALPKSPKLGVEFTDREIKTPVGTNYFEWREKGGRVYAYWPITLSTTGRDLGRAQPTLAFFVEYQLEKLERPLEFTGDEAVLDMDTHYVPLGVTVHSGEHLSWQFRTTKVMQEGRRQVDAFSTAFDVSSHFWISDLSLIYRLANRRGRLSLGVNNLFDRDFVHVDADLSSPRFATGRLVLGRLTLSF